MLYVGVDLGTSAVKLLLMDEKGEIKNVISREYPLFFPHHKAVSELIRNKSLFQEHLFAFPDRFVFTD